MAAQTAGTAGTAGASTIGGNEVSPDPQGDPAAAAPTETAAGARKGGAAAAVDALVYPIEPRPPPFAVPAPLRPTRRWKSKASKYRDADLDNRLSMESFTPQDVLNKSNLVSTTAQWSFYPLNVTFVSEVDSKEERYLYATIAVVAGVIFALLVVAVALLLSSKRHAPYTACNTHECIEAQDFLTRLLNTSKDACSDFYGYVCGSWLARSSGSFLEDSAAASAAKTIERLFLSQIQGADEETKSPTSRVTGGTEDTNVVRGLYQRCHRYVSEKATTSATFRESLEAARSDLNWTLIRHASSFRDLMTLVARTSLLAGFHTVFALNLLTENDKLVLRLSAGKSLLCKLTLSWSRKELEDVLRRVLDDAQELAQVLSLDNIVADDLPDCEHDDAAVDDGSIPLSTLFAGLVPSVNASDWIDCLNALVLPAAKKDVSNVALESGADRVRSAFGKIYEPWRPRRCLAYSWPQLVARLLDLGQSTQVIQPMYLDLKWRSRNASFFRWLTDASRDAAVEKISRAGLVVSGNVRAAEGAKADYAWLASHLEESAGTDFLRLFVRMLEHEHALRLQSPPTRLQLLTLRLERHARLTYAAALNDMMVPTLYQSRPLLYPAGVPAYFNYGTVGTLLATRIIEVMAPAPSASATLPGRLVCCLFYCCKP
ncbi:hypothetical protein MTO96_033060 [Rhipicephalus appendiculatus]